MAITETIFAFPSLQASAKNAPPPPPPATAASRKDSLVLDMGEASREEGFRLYGCR